MDTQTRIFLTDAEMVELTGAKRPSAQVRWLTTNGIPLFINKLGKPVVPVSAIDPKHGSKPERATNDTWVPSVLKGSN